MYSTTILKKFLWQGRRYTCFKYTILAFFAILPAGCALRALRFGRVSTDFDIRGQERAKGVVHFWGWTTMTAVRSRFAPLRFSVRFCPPIRYGPPRRTVYVRWELFSPSVGCADSSLVRGSKGQDAGRTQRPGAFLSVGQLRRQLPRQRERKEQDSGSTQRPGAFLSPSRLRRQLPRQRERKEQDSGSTQRPGAFLSLSRLRRQLPRQRELKEQDADLEGTKRVQTGFGKTWRKGVQKAGSGGDAGAQELISDLLNLQSVGAGERNTKETHGRRQEVASPAAHKCAAGLVGDILLTIRDGQEIRPCRPSRTAPSSP